MNKTSRWEEVHENSYYVIISVCGEPPVMDGYDELSNVYPFNKYLAINKHTRTIEAEPSLLPEAIGLADAMSDSLEQHGMFDTVSVEESGIIAH